MSLHKELFYIQDYWSYFGRKCCKWVEIFLHNFFVLKLEKWIQIKVIKYFKNSNLIECYDFYVKIVRILISFSLRFNIQKLIVKWTFSKNDLIFYVLFNFLFSVEIYLNIVFVLSKVALYQENSWISKHTILINSPIHSDVLEIRKISHNLHKFTEFFANTLLHHYIK